MEFERCPYCGASARMAGAPQRCAECGRALPEPDPAHAVIDVRADEPESEEADVEVVPAEPVFDDEGRGPSQEYGPRAQVRVFRYQGNYSDHSGCCCGLGCLLLVLLFALALQGLTSLF